MLRIAKRLSVFVSTAVVIAAVSLVSTGAAAAASGAGCNPSPLFNDVRVCVVIDSDQVWGYVNNPLSNFTDATVYVRQCSPTNLDQCGVIAANSSTGFFFSLSTSKKTAALGHVYDTCASWHDFADKSDPPKLFFACSVFRSYP